MPYFYPLSKFTSKHTCSVELDIGVDLSYVINRPGVAGAVLQTPLSFINSLIQSLALFLQIFKAS